MAKIKDLVPYEILDSRGNPTVACQVILDDGFSDTGYVPAGASTGKKEVLELRDNDRGRYNGMGVLGAVKNISEIIKPAIIGMDSYNIEQIDKKMIELDGTENRSKLGANAILAVSLGVVKAEARSKKIELYRHLGELLGKSDQDQLIPIPLMNILNGGKHAVGSTDFQEFMIVPVKFESFSRALEAGVEVYHNLGKILDERSYQPLIGDEGGYAPSLFSNEQAMELLMMSIKAAGYHAGEDIFIALDPAASRLFSENSYQLHRENRALTTDQMLEYYQTWSEKYPVISLEDGLSEDDRTGWIELTKRLGDRVEIIGDDLYCTNEKLLEKGAADKASTGILIKPNQAGSVSETLNTIKKAEELGYKIIVSHRSGETKDTFIADLAVASGCGTIKTGAPARGERTAKYNRLLKIEKASGNKFSYAKWDGIK